MTSNKMTTAQVSNPYDVATGINQVWDDEVELDRFFRQFNQAGGESHVWRRAEQIARGERVATIPNYPPNLIDLDAGEIWECRQCGSHTHWATHHHRRLHPQTWSGPRKSIWTATH